MEFMKNVPDKRCNCLPDCIGTIYEPEITSTPLRKCDSRNFGASWLCDPDNGVQPSMYADDINFYYYDLKFGNRINIKKRSLRSKRSNLFSWNNFKDFMGPEYKWYESNRRKYVKEDLFYQGIETPYQAYEKDIALVEVFFKKPTIIQIERRAKMNWIDYFATVGGLLGLVLGMSIISFIELLWLCLRIAALKMNFHNLIP